MDTFVYNFFRELVKPRKNLQTNVWKTTNATGRFPAQLQSSDIRKGHVTKLQMKSRFFSTTVTNKIQKQAK